MTKRMLTISKVVDKRMWHWEHPFKQCDGLSYEILTKLEKRKLTIDKMRDMDAKEIGIVLFLFYNCLVILVVFVLFRKFV